MSDHMFTEDGICDCTECWPTDTKRPTREATMNLEVGRTYKNTGPDWAEAVKALQPGIWTEAWWKTIRQSEQVGRRGVACSNSNQLQVAKLTARNCDGSADEALLRFTVLGLPARLDPTRALVVRDTYGDLWAMVAGGDRWQALNGEDWATHSTAALHHPLTVVIDADGNVVDEGDR